MMSVTVGRNRFIGPLSLPTVQCASLIAPYASSGLPSLCPTESPLVTGSPGQAGR
jgi:hypothetical protein